VDSSSEQILQIVRQPAKNLKDLEIEIKDQKKEMKSLQIQKKKLLYKANKK
jgi:hypothetical protein